MSGTADNQNGETVAVLGCGLMGSALVLAMVDAGIKVVAWNRTASKVEPLVERGAVGAQSVSEAVITSTLVVSCLATYEDTLEVLSHDTVPADLRGKTLVNLATGTPPDAERLQRWAVDREVSYLDGAIPAYPQDIGSPDLAIVYSGSEEMWTRYESVLRSLGGASKFLSSNVATANVIDVAIIGAFYTVALGAFVEAAAYADACGVGVEDLMSSVAAALDLLDRGVREGADSIVSRHFETDQATLDVFVDGSKTFLEAMLDAGQHASLMEAQLSNLERAQAASRGPLGFFAQFETAGK